jgi:hypothetical protein
MEPLEDLIATLTKQRDDLEAIRKELGDELLACPPRSRLPAHVEKVHALKIAILTLDGRLDASPDAYLLLDKLKARGYRAPESQPWNEFGALFGCLQAIERRLRMLQREPVSA